MLHLNYNHNLFQDINKLYEKEIVRQLLLMIIFYLKLINIIMKDNIYYSFFLIGNNLANLFNLFPRFRNNITIFPTFSFKHTCTYSCSVSHSTIHKYFLILFVLLNIFVNLNYWKNYIFFDLREIHTSSIFNDTFFFPFSRSSAVD